MAYDYCEYTSEYWESFPRARKRHRCIECNGWIEPGEVYLNYRGIGDGFFSGSQHMDCRELCMHIRDHLNGGECLCFGGLFEFWGDAMIHNLPGISAPESKARSLMAKIKWRKRSQRQAVAAT